MVVAPPAGQCCLQRHKNCSQMTRGLQILQIQIRSVLSKTSQTKSDPWRHWAKNSVPSLHGHRMSGASSGVWHRYIGWVLLRARWSLNVSDCFWVLLWTFNQVGIWRIGTQSQSFYSFLSIFCSGEESGSKVRKCCGHELWRAQSIHWSQLGISAKGLPFQKAFQLKNSHITQWITW